MGDSHWMVRGVTYSETLLRSYGWTDEHFKTENVCRVRERTWTNDRQGRYIETTNTKRAQLIDDIDALCLSIETRQKQLSQLVKELQNER